MSSGQSLTTAYEKDEIIKDVISTLPTTVQPLTIKYSTHTVDLGKELTPTDTQHAPAITAPSNIDQNAYYTLMLVDPDAPSRRRPRFRNFVHWVVVNIRGADISTGHTLAEYNGPAPPKGSGKHRYVFLLFKQSASAEVSKLPKFTSMNRGGWTTDVLIKKLVDAGVVSLEIVATNYFNCAWDQHVEQYYRSQLGIMYHPMMFIMRMLM